MIFKVFFLCFPLIIIFYVKNSLNLLLFPQYSVFQVTSAFSVPVVIPKRKLFFDWGFQMNYNLPFNVSNFYNVPIWPRHKNKRSESIETTKIDTLKLFDKYAPNRTMHHYDMSAGELYGILEDLLLSFGYHETCLLKSVCDLAKHPFDMRNRENLIAEIIHFVMSPSLHQAFADDEIHYRDAYETAEFYGKIGDDCNVMYPDCPSGILDKITKIIF